MINNLKNRIFDLYQYIFGDEKKIHDHSHIEVDDVLEKISLKDRYRENLKSDILLEVYRILQTGSADDISGFDKDKFGALVYGGDNLTLHDISDLALSMGCKATFSLESIE